jgi:anti-sigma factor RsiW
MTGDRFTDEMLMAYADGEVDGETAASIEAAMSSDASVRSRIDVFARTRTILAAAAADRLAAPVPTPVTARALAAIEAARQPEYRGNVLPLGKARSARSWGFPEMAVAATIALAVGIAAGFGLAPREPAGLRVASISPEVITALSSVPSGERTEVAGGQFVAIASFRTADGDLCREFEFDAPDRSTLISVACRDGAAWDLRLAIVAPSADASGYAPASSLDTLDAYLSAMGAGAPLTAEEEATAIEAEDQ